MRKKLLFYACCLGLFNLASAQQSTTYSFTGGLQTFTVPCGVTQVHVAAYGAQGGSGAVGANSAAGGAGGLGGFAEGDLTVSPGDVLNVVVGGQGATPTGGFNGGGNGGSQNAGGGGGSSDVRVGGTAESNRVIVAGGGGGGGRAGCELSVVTGGNGGAGGSGVGAIGTDAPTSNGVAGGGGGGNFGSVQGAAGTAGIGCSGFLGQPGTAAASGQGGNGGNGQSCCCFNAQSIPGGGGGGGGYLGGGGGGGGSAGTTGCSGNDKGAGGGGGGGSSYIGGVSNGVQSAGTNTGNGQVVITWIYNAPAQPAFTASPTAACLGSTATYTVANDPNATSFVWSVTGGLSISSGAGSNTITVLCSGDGTVSVAAQNACETSSSSSVTVTVNNLPNAVVTGGSTICQGSSTTLTAGGGTSYSWSNGLGGNSQVTVSPSSVTTYSVTVTDANGCTATAQQQVSVNSVPTASITGASVVCEGSSTDLTAGTGTSYDWSNSLGSNATVSVSPTSTTVYTVTVTGANGCTATAQQSVSINALPTASISGTATICEGGSTTLTAAGGNSYSWSDGLGTNDAVTVTPTGNTIYSVVVTDANNCSASAEQTVTVNTLPVAAITGTASVCEGTSADLTATGGTDYSWDNGLGTSDQVTVTPAATTTYNVTVTDANNCSNTAAYTVTVLEHTSSQFSHTMCQGESYLFNGVDQVAAGSYTDTLVNANGCDSVITLVLTVNALPQPTASNTGNVLTTESFTSYQWLQDGAVINNGTTQSYTATANGNYSVVVTDANGCSDTSNVVNITGLSIGAINAEAGIKLYPNPNNGRFALEFANAADREIAISDVVGKVVYSTKANTQIVNVNAELPAGVYSVQVIRNKQLSTLKITVTK